MKAIASAGRVAGVFSIALLAMMLSACQPPTQHEPTATSASDHNSDSATSALAIVKIDPVSATIRAGEAISVAVRVENATDLAGAEVHLTFDPKILEVIDADLDQAGVQIANGDLLAEDVVAQNQVDNEAGTIDYGVVQLQRASVSGSGRLAIIRLRGKASGASPIAFRGIEAAPSGAHLANSRSAPIDHQLAPGSIAVN